MQQQRMPIGFNYSATFFHSHAHVHLNTIVVKSAEWSHAKDIKKRPKTALPQSKQEQGTYMTLL